MARKPELLAPAGDLASLRAALAAGADAVYFGLDDGFNARARADNFSLAGLAATVLEIHRAGARAYLTLNTLLFESELVAMAEILGRVAVAGVDAVIVQDPAVALLARAICPALEVHASTQMTVSSAEAGRFARGLGVTRVVVPRELSVDEIRRFAAGSDLELEVFAHGALCVSWSGQCLTSEAWGGRSANRGQCAQSCRMPYDLVVDGEVRELGEVAYLLSPKDLAGVDAVPALLEIGVHGLKIEGRQKGPTYVATATAGYRRWLDSVAAGRPDRRAMAQDLADMAITYTRGFSSGFLAGADHQTLVEGRFPKHRGLLLGRVSAVVGDQVLVVPDPEGRPWTGGRGATEPPAAPVGPAAPLAEPATVTPRAGMGVVFDAGRPEAPEQGGPVFRVDRHGQGWRLGFGRPGPDLGHVAPGQRVWLSGDPALERGTDKLPGPQGRIALVLEVSGRAGQPLRVSARGRGLHAHVDSAQPLQAAQGSGLDRALLVDKLGALGGTPFRVEALEVGALAPGLHVPVSALKALRRALVAALEAELARGPTRAVAEPRAALATLQSGVAAPQPGPAELVALCRSDAQLEAVIAARLPEVELDWMELVGLSRAVARARQAGLRVTVATTRVHKPGEEGYDARLAALAPDAVLVRHWAALTHFGEAGPAPRPTLHGDFSLNVTNSITARHLLGLGLDTLTAAHDLDAVQLAGLLERVPPERMTIVLHHHIATFHTEHCVYAHLLSAGRDYRTCGRPCEQHALSLRDHVGLAHPVIVDVGCRNTVFNAQAHSAAALVPRLRERGVRRFRVEMVRETQAEAATVLASYGELLAGRITPAEAVRRVGVHEQFGVTRGTMRVLAAASAGCD